MGVEAQIAQILFGNPANAPEGPFAKTTGEAFVVSRDAYAQNLAFALRARPDRKGPCVGKALARPLGSRLRGNTVHGWFLPPSGRETKAREFDRNDFLGPAGSSRNDRVGRTAA